MSHNAAWNRQCTGTRYIQTMYQRRYVSFCVRALAQCARSETACSYYEMIDVSSTHVLVSFCGSCGL